MPPMNANAWQILQGPLLFAHRGACLEHPENSLPAFQRALELGADVLEMDVHMTSDGRIVVSHDPSAQRTAGVDRQIRLCPLSEVKTWDIGRGFANTHTRHRSAALQIRIPTLNEVIEAFPAARMNVDIKQLEPDVTQTMVELIERLQATDRILLTSFHLTVLRRVRRLGYPGPIGLSRFDAGRAVLLPRPLNRLLGPIGCRAQIPVRYGPVPLATRPLISKLHGLGLAVDYWVVNHPRQAARLLQIGADGIVTDDIAAMAELFRVNERTAGWRQRHA